MERRLRPRPQRILVVDDSEDLRHMWKAWLMHWGFAVDEARDGAEAIRQALAHRPDIVLMDLWMPVLDGFNATRRLKSDPSTADVPVLAVSAYVTADGLAQARDAGCDEFVPKPIQPDELLLHIRAALGRREEPLAGHTSTH